MAKVFNDGGLASIDVHLSSGGEFTLQRWATQQGGFWDAQKWTTGDFNADGRDDMAKAFNDSHLASIDVHLSTSSGFTFQRSATQQGGYWDAQKWVAGDFNGDGVDEMAKAFNDSHLASIDTHISTFASVNGTGNSLNNSIAGNNSNNIINGKAGSDFLSGNSGADIFAFQFGESTLFSMDRITDFTANNDKIDLLTASGFDAGIPLSLTRAEDNPSESLNAFISNVFTDANGGITGPQSLGLNSAVLAVTTANSIAGTYLIINDSNSGFQSTTDLVVNLSGYIGRLPDPGTLSASLLFI
jgi:Ca2+-binding RTX toxin-like protein